MPRNLSQAVLDLLATKTGIDPYLIVALPWGMYADRTIGTDIKGKVLEINNLDEVLRTDIGGGKSGNISITLDDSDGELASIIENLDIHKLPVQIYQGLTSVDKFLLFDGQISSPIEWDEGQRTFKFDCLNIIEDFEVGFSPEDGQFTNLHQDLIGKPWPLGFGTVNYVPALPLQVPPVTITYDEFGLLDLGIFEQIARLKSQYAKLLRESQEEYQLGLALLIAAAYAHYAGDEESEQFDLNTSVALQQDAQQKGQEAKSIVIEINQIFGLLQDQLRYDPFNYNSLSQYISLITSPGNLIRDGLLSSTLLSGGETSIDVPSFNFNPGVSPIFRFGATRLIRIVTKDQFPTSGRYVLRIGNNIFDAEITRIDNNFSNVRLSYIPPQIRVPFEIQSKGYTIAGDAALKQGFTYYPPGTSVSILSAYPLETVVNIIPSTVTGVYAYRSYNGLRKLSLVPPQYYTVTVGHATSGGNPTGPSDSGDTGQNPYVPKVRNAGWFAPTLITLNQPLSTISYIKNLEITQAADLVSEVQSQILLRPFPSRVLPLIEWEDQLYVSYISSVGPNTVDILIWIINTFTTKKYDAASFATVRTYLTNMPSSFVLFDKKNVLDQLSDIATQAMCIIYLKDNTFYINYLPAMSAPTDTITASDILDKSLTLVGSGTEDLVTRYIATWRPNYSPDVESNRIQLKTNVLKYGLHSKNEDYYIYNVYYLVKKSLTYWLIIKANTWKLINFKTPITKLNIETLDTITIDLPDLHISNGPVDGIVQSAVYDSVNDEIAISVWLPVRFGEMDPYVFAFPANATETDVYPTLHDISAGGGTGGLYSYSPGILPNFTGGDQNNAGPIFVDDTQKSIGGMSGQSFNTSTRPAYLPLQYPADSTITSPILPYLSPPISVPISNPPTGDYVLSDYRVKNYPVNDATTASAASSYPGIIVSGKGTKYKVNVYTNGTDQKATKVDAVQLQIDTDDVIPIGTWVIVVKVAGSYYMQTPVWL